ncbi:MAG: efflux RND transporter periplasmic adaptor subunit [Steroidobacteraceae bacterium]
MIDEEQPAFWSRHRYKLLAGLVLVSGAALGYRALQPQPVLASAVREGPAERVLAITGRTRPRLTVTIVPERNGQILKLTREEGDRVSKGDLLVTLDAAATRAVLAQVEQELASRRRALVEAERNYQRLAQLRASGLATVKEYDQSRFDLDQARVELNRVAASRREASARLDEATIVAPVSGVVLARPVDVGQVVSAQTTIYEIAPLADVEIEADIDERFLGELHTGMSARIVIVGERDVRAATLDYISPKVDARTGGARVRFRLAQPAEDLRAGLTADINLIVETRGQALTISRSAILGRDANARVLVIEGKRVVQRSIRFIDWPGEEVIVEQGVKAGERVLSQPNPALVGHRVAQVERLAQASRASARRAL